MFRDDLHVFYAYDVAVLWSCFFAILFAHENVQRQSFVIQILRPCHSSKDALGIGVFNLITFHQNIREQDRNARPCQHHLHRSLSIQVFRRR